MHWLFSLLGRVKSIATVQIAGDGMSMDFGLNGIWNRSIQIGAEIYQFFLFPFQSIHQGPI